MMFVFFLLDFIRLWLPVYISIRYIHLYFLHRSTGTWLLFIFLSSLLLFTCTCSKLLCLFLFSIEIWNHYSGELFSATNKTCHTCIFPRH